MNARRAVVAVFATVTLGAGAAIVASRFGGACPDRIAPVDQAVGTIRQVECKHVFVVFADDEPLVLWDRDPAYPSLTIRYLPDQGTFLTPPRHGVYGPWAEGSRSGGRVYAAL